LTASATAKLVPWEGKAENFGKLGFSVDVMFVMGFVEVVILIGYLLPRTSLFAGLVLLTYLGGATAAHVRVGDPFFVPVVVGVVAWVALLLRRPEAAPLLLGKRPTATAA
ncbi:MAG: DoxX family protein, partial [Planctomycetota bacterium]